VGEPQPAIGNLTSAGFDAGQQGVLLSGRTRNGEVLVVVHREGIEESFPGLASTSQCVSFVERNLASFRDIVNTKLSQGDIVALPATGGWHPEILVELTGIDVLRSRRWFTP
jgi:hypothetical protein